MNRAKNNRVSYEGRVTVFEGLSGFPLLSLNPMRPCVLGGVVRSTKYPKALRRTEVYAPRTLRFRESYCGTSRHPKPPSVGDDPRRQAPSTPRRPHSGSQAVALQVV